MCKSARQSTDTLAKVGAHEVERLELVPRAEARPAQPQLVAVPDAILHVVGVVWSVVQRERRRIAAVLEQLVDAELKWGECGWLDVYPDLAGLGAVRGTDQVLVRQKIALRVREELLLVVVAQELLLKL